MWYYISTITGSANYQNLDGKFAKLALTGVSDEKPYQSSFPFSENPNSSVYSHKASPQKYGFESPKGGKVVLSDSSNKADVNYYTKVESQSGKMMMLDDVSDAIVLKTEHEDGLKVTGHHYGEKVLVGPGPGPRSVTLEANQNVFIEADNGSLNADVKGGYQLNIRNETCNVPALRPMPLDPKCGEVNIESNANSINIQAHNRNFLYDPTSHTMPAKGVFIDASMFQGVVQIKAGRGGVEIFSDGDIDFNCAGNFNVNALGDINFRAASTVAGNYQAWSANPAPFLHPPTGGGFVNLNPITPLPSDTKKPIPTFNNDQLYPVG